ncbi:MAG: DUF4168 domain-containing protein [Elainellaceae cyanobacterium]
MFDDITWGRRLGLALLLSLLIWTIGRADLAIAVSSNAPPPGEAMPAAQSGRLDISAISSEKVSQFIEAYQRVISLVEDQEDALRGAETESDFLQRQGDLERKIGAAIEDVGLSRQEYVQLLGLANSDPEFSERIASQLQESGEL